MHDYFPVTEGKQEEITQRKKGTKTVPLGHHLHPLREVRKRHIYRLGYEVLHCTNRLKLFIFLKSCQNFSTEEVKHSYVL